MESDVNNTARNARLTPLGALASLRAGYAFRTAIPESADGDVLAVQLRDFKGTETLDWSSVIRTALCRAPADEEWLRSGDVLFTFRGTRFFAAVLERVPAPAVAGTQFMLLRVRDPLVLHPAFLAWQLNQSFAQTYFNQAAGGTAQRSLRRAVVEGLQMVVPSLQVQHAVVALVDLVRRERVALQEVIRIREEQLGEVAVSLLMSAGAAVT